MSFRQSVTLITLSLLLGACQHFRGEPPVEVRQVISEQRPTGCAEQDERCPLVNIDTQLFADEPALNALIDARLRKMTVNSPDAEVPATLEGYQQAFLRNAEPGWSSYLQSKLIDQHGSLLVIELSSYLYTGGAHGMPGRGFINYDREQDRELGLADVLLRDKVLLKYDVYSIAPYSSGHPELEIPYTELRAIVKPEYLP